MRRAIDLTLPLRDGMDYYCTGHFPWEVPFKAEHRIPKMVKQAAQAEANLILSEPIALKACDLMKERFGLPYLCADEMAPWSLESTAAWVRKAAEFFGKEDLAEALIERELGECAGGNGPDKKPPSGEASQRGCFSR